MNNELFLYFRVICSTDLRDPEEGGAWCHEPYIFMILPFPYPLNNLARHPCHPQYILWFHEYKESSLTVLRLREPPPDARLRGLVDAVMSEARRSNF